jgi:hypothetical protein
LGIFTLFFFFFRLVGHGNELVSTLSSPSVYTSYLQGLPLVCESVCESPTRRHCRSPPVMYLDGFYAAV